jgi:LysM domain
MSVMSAAEAGESPGTGQELLPRGPRTAASATDREGVGPGASPGDERPAHDGPAGPGRRDRRLRLITTERHVTEVRVARQISTRTVRADGPQPGAPGPGDPRADVPRAGAQRAEAARGTAQRTGVPRGTAHRVSAERASVRRASVHRVDMPGASARRVSMQRASAQRVVMQETSARPAGWRLTRRGRRVLTGLIMLVIVISAMLIWTGVAGGAQAPGPGTPARSVYQGMTPIVVQPGQTLWSIAAAVDPSANPWAAVQQISDANALTGTQIEAGQLLWVPRG